MEVEEEGRGGGSEVLKFMYHFGAYHILNTSIQQE